MGLCVCVSLPSTWEKRVTPDRRLLCDATCIDKNQQQCQLTMHFTPAGGHSMSLGLCPTKLPVTWEERTDHPLVPATKFVTSLSCRLYMVPFCDILAVQIRLSRAAQVDSLAFAYARV